MSLLGISVPGVDFNAEVSTAAILKTIKVLSHKYLFPNVSKMSINSKTSRIIRQYPRVIIKDHLYALFENKETQIDSCIDELIDDGKIRLVNINFDNNFRINILILFEDFDNSVKNNFKNSENPMYTRYISVLEDNLDATQLTEEDLEDLNTSLLISKGLICMSTNDTELNDHEYLYNITLPHLGGLLRIVKSSMQWICTIIDKSQQKMMKYDEIHLRWTKPFIQNNTNNFKREYFTTNRVGISNGKAEVSGPGVNIVKFRSIGLNWVICLMVGIGILETVDTSVGVFFKTTGKNI